MNDNEVELDKLSEKVRKYVEDMKKIDAEIKEFNESSAFMEQAIQEIGEVGAENKWTSLFNQAQAALQKAKKNVTEKVKKDIKTIHQQLKSFKSGTNTYLSKFYQKEKSKVDKLENDLVTYSNTSQTGSPNKTP
ncbi:10265_t:CDS:1 [Paraglomus brasilianum]|uniref:10265_t:CDS:1 n=1 Tax=Paraglomus brasilianum TaxID=144538 RepID=A0A9N9D7Z6_9GLOM|nr:10265_t:CDS:1 [Paraglomus brasilianum]